MTQYEFERALEEEADHLLEERAKSEHVSLRKLGVINRRRDRTVHQREIPFSSAFARRRHGRDS